MATNVGSPKQSCPFKKAKEKEEVQDPEKHWIKYKFVDTNGKPVPNVNIQVVLPDSSIVEKASDENGMVEIKNIESGNCKILYDWEDVNDFETMLLD